MSDVYLMILLDVIKEKYYSEKVFYQTQLGIDEEAWNDFKQGKRSLSAENTQKLKNLFTDYEWMLFQKVLRQTVVYPEKRGIAVKEYRKMKYLIASKWMNHQLAKVEIVEESNQNQEKQALLLAVHLYYQEWGYDDILTFRVPARLQKQLASDQIKLLDWFDEQIEEN